MRLDFPSMAKIRKGGHSVKNVIKGLVCRFSGTKPPCTNHLSDDYCTGPFWRIVCFFHVAATSTITASHALLTRETRGHIRWLVRYYSMRSRPLKHAPSKADQLAK